MFCKTLIKNSKYFYCFSESHAWPLAEILKTSARFREKLSNLPNWSFAQYCSDQTQDKTSEVRWTPSSRSTVGRSIVLPHAGAGAGGLSHRYEAGSRFAVLYAPLFVVQSSAAPRASLSHWPFSLSYGPALPRLLMKKRRDRTGEARKAATNSLT